MTMWDIYEYQVQYTFGRTASMSCSVRILMIKRRTEKGTDVRLTTRASPQTQLPYCEQVTSLVGQNLFYRCCSQLLNEIIYIEGSFRNITDFLQSRVSTSSGLGRSIPHLSIFGNIAPFYVRLLTSSIYISQRRTRSMSVSKGQSVIWCQKCTTRPSEIFHDEGYYCTRCWNVIKEPRT